MAENKKFTRLINSDGTKQAVALDMVSFDEQTKKLTLYSSVDDTIKEETIIPASEVDATLSQSGLAADAKATGDAVKDVVKVGGTASGFTGIIVGTGEEEIELVEQKDFDAEIAKLNAKVGTPLVANTASAMVDTTKIYVYTGNENGYVNGNWYFYNGTNWESGGVYNAVAVQTDKTLTQENKAADAKKTGDEISELKEDLTELVDASYLTDTVTGKVLTVDDSALSSVKSIETEADKICRTGINLWDEQWEIGQYSTANGLPVYNQNAIRCKNPIPIHPETDYYFKSPYHSAFMFYDESDSFLSYQTGSNKKITSPANAYYMRFHEVSQYGTTYNNDIQFTFDSDADKTAYHAYSGKVFENIEAVTLVPESKNYIYAVGSDDVIGLTYFKKETSSYIAKKPYQSGFIVFSVPSRLTKSNNSVGTSVVSEGTDDSVDVNCILKLPTTYTPNGVPTKLIMICHGAGQSAQQWSTNASYIALTDAFTTAGYAVFDCNGYRENALGYSFCGDSRGVDVWRKAYQYVVDNYNVEHQFGLYGFSMGGLTALNLAFSGFPNIKCIALGSPVVSLEACYNSESVKAVIKVLYGMGDTYNPALAYGCDPYARIIAIDNVNYIFGMLPPIKMWYGSTENGTTDTGAGEVVTGIVVKAYGEAIVTAINNAGGQAEYREVANAGHEICYGGNAVVNSDLVLYFNRHCL